MPFSTFYTLIIKTFVVVVVVVVNADVMLMLMMMRILMLMTMTMRHAKQSKQFLKPTDTDFKINTTDIRRVRC